MKNTLKAAIASIMLAACALTAAVPAYAHGHGNGNSSHHEEQTHCGWTEIDGKQYYYNQDGTCVNKSCKIDGIRYKFTSDGVCQGPYTGWTKSGSKRFYYRSGVKQYGWVNVKTTTRWVDFQLYKGNWYYIDSKKGRLTGKQTIDGIEYTFDSKGRWDGKGSATDKNGQKLDFISLGSEIMTGIGNDMYGGLYVKDGMCVVTSIDGKAEKWVKKHFPDASCVVYKKADYSMKELREVEKYFLTDEAKELWTGCCACEMIDDEFCNRFIVEAVPGEMMDRLTAYVETLPCKDMILIQEGGYAVVDAAIVTVPEE